MICVNKDYSGGITPLIIAKHYFSPITLPLKQNECNVKFLISHKSVLML